MGFVATYDLGFLSADSDLGLQALKTLVGAPEVVSSSEEPETSVWGAELLDTLEVREALWTLEAWRAGWGPEGNATSSVWALDVRGAFWIPAFDALEVREALWTLEAWGAGWSPEEPATSSVAGWSTEWPATYSYTNTNYT